RHRLPAAARRPARPAHRRRRGIRRPGASRARGARARPPARVRGGGGGVTAVASVDAVTVEVVRHGLIGVADEMKLNLMRTAYNPIIYEVLDFSVGVFDGKGRMVAQADGLPIFLGNLGIAVKCVVDD